MNPERTRMTLERTRMIRSVGVFPDRLAAIALPYHQHRLVFYLPGC